MTAKFFSNFLLLCICISSPVYGQHSLDFYADVVVSAANEKHKYEAAQEFERILSEQLKVDSLFKKKWGWRGIPVLYTPDSSLRMLSWGIPNPNSKDPGSVLVKAVLQFKGSQKLTFLVDKSDFERSNETSVLFPQRWLGAVYTHIYSIPQHDSLYLVYGQNPLDEYRMLHVLDVIDIRDSIIRFGHPLWQNKDSTRSVRKVYEVARGAQFRPKIHPESERIVVDHLRSVPYDQSTSVRVNVPDGTYIFYDWQGDKWIYNDRLFDDDQERVIRNPKKRKEAAQRDLFGNPKD